MKTGIDIVENQRIADNLKIYTKILTQREQAIFLSLSEFNQIEFLAGRWALKEAIIKCDNTLLMSQIEILNDASGAPCVNLTNYSISLSHEKHYTVAIAIKN